MTDFSPELTQRIEGLIRDVPDFPKPGIVFKDLMPVFGDGPTFRALIGGFVDRYEAKNVDAIVGIEARGFIVAAPVASALESGLVLLRKPGKLPWKTVSKSYDLEYGQDALHMHEDAIREGQRIVLLDDLLATGGTMQAAIELVRSRGAEVVEVGFIVELGFLEGRKRLGDVPAVTMLSY